MRNKRCFLTGFWLFVCSFTLFAAEPVSINIPLRECKCISPLARYKPDCPQFILALSGGGARGLAHIGVLRALEEEGIRPDGIAGVSSGALVGGLYSHGFSADEITERLQVIDWRNVITDEPERRSLLLARKQEFSRHFLELRIERGFIPIIPGAITPGQELYANFLELTLDLPYRYIHDWNDLPVPINILGANLNTGDPIIFNCGDIAVAQRASMAVPLLLDPIKLDSIHVVDGGIVSNIPVDLGRSMGADVVVAVDVTAELHEIDTPYQPWEIIDQVTTILEQEYDQKALENADLTVFPNVTNLGNRPGDENLLIEAGYLAMKEKLHELKKLLEPDWLWQDTTSIAIQKVEIIGSEFDLLSRFPVEVPGRVKISEIKRYLAEIQALPVTQQVEAQYFPNSQTLQVDAILTPVLNSIQITGNSIIEKDKLLDCFPVQSGHRYDYQKIEEAILCMLRLYRENGYCQAGIADQSFDFDTGTLRIEIDEGILGDISLIGLDQIHKGSIFRELYVKQQKPVTKQAVLKSLSNLYATGLFRSVISDFKTNPTGSGQKLDLHFVEYPASILRLGLAYQSQLKTRGFGELSWYAPFNYKARVNFYTALGEMDNEHHITFSFHHGARLSLMTHLRAGYWERKRIPFDSRHKHLDLQRYTEAHWGMQFEVGGQAFSWGLLSATGRWERHKNRYFDSKLDYNLAAIGARLAVDNLDRYPYPNSGISMDLQIEGSGNFLPSEVKFNKFNSSFESYVEPLDRYVVGFRFAGRTADRTTPRDEQFKLGGIHEFPGLNLDEEMGLVQIVSGLELRLDLLSRMLADTYIGLRLDVAGNWEDPEAQIDRTDWFTSAAVYFALDTVLGPVHVQWGHLFPNRNILKQDILFVQVGNTF